MTQEFTELQKLRIAFLVGRYATTDEIASDMRITCTESAVRFFVDRAGLPPPCANDSDAFLRVEIPRDLIPVLDAAAQRRGFGRTEMAGKLLAEVLAENLIGAVMDDGMP